MLYLMVNLLSFIVAFLQLFEHNCVMVVKCEGNLVAFVDPYFCFISQTIIYFLFSCLNLSICADYNLVHRHSNGPEAESFNNPLFSGVMALVMGIMAMIRVTRNMPKRLTDATIYSSPAYCGDNDMHRLPPPDISSADYFTTLKRMAELEEKLNVLCTQPSITAEKEEILNATLSRVNALEQEITSTRKV